MILKIHLQRSFIRVDDRILQIFHLNIEDFHFILLEISRLIASFRMLKQESHSTRCILARAYMHQRAYIL